MSSREKLKKRIEELPKNQQIEIFKILEKNNCEFSQNNNAIFFNLSKIDYKVIRKINESIKYYDKIIDDENKNINLRKQYEEILETKTKNIDGNIDDEDNDGDNIEDIKE